MFWHLSRFWSLHCSVLLRVHVKDQFHLFPDSLIVSQHSPCLKDSLEYRVIISICYNTTWFLWEWPVKRNTFVNLCVNIPECCHLCSEGTSASRTCFYKKLIAFWGEICLPSPSPLMVSIGKKSRKKIQIGHKLPSSDHALNLDDYMIQILGKTDHPHSTVQINAPTAPSV